MRSGIISGCPMTRWKPGRPTPMTSEFDNVPWPLYNAKGRPTGQSEVRGDNGHHYLGSIKQEAAARRDPQKDPPIRRAGLRRQGISQRSGRRYRESLRDLEGGGVLLF